MRWIAGLLIFGAIAAAGMYAALGRTDPPRLAITQPGRVVGPQAAVEVTATAPNGNFSALTISIEQHGRRFPLFALDPSQTGGTTASGGVVAQVDRNNLRIEEPFGQQRLPELESGPAKVIVEAESPSLLNLRTLTARAEHEFQIRLEPPRIAVLSTHHYVSQGGAEMVVYRATPGDVSSGVRVGTLEYPGFPLGDAPELRAAFFALLYDQPPDTPIVAFARDETGREASAGFVDRAFPKAFRRSRIALDDPFMGRVVPEILEHAPELNMTAPVDPAGMLEAYLQLNGELRKKNAATIAAYAAETSSTRLWEGPFIQLGNSAVEASFADRRTYAYDGKEVDQQTHLGFDLASTARVPILASNAGRVLHAGWLGIYGNCVIIDHGMGVQSLYGHLSSFDVAVGDAVARGQPIGRTGMTGLAGGDHLHFTMLVGGQMVNPVEWWDPHWIADRIERKLAESGGSAAGRQGALKVR